MALIWDPYGINVKSMYNEYEISMEWIIYKMNMEPSESMCIECEMNMEMKWIWMERYFGLSVLRAPAEQTKVATVLGN